MYLIEGDINYYYPNSNKSTKYSILDFTKSVELIDVDKNNTYSDIIKNLESNNFI